MVAYTRVCLTIWLSLSIRYKRSLIYLLLVQSDISYRQLSALFYTSIDDGLLYVGPTDIAFATKNGLGSSQLNVTLNRAALAVLCICALHDLVDNKNITLQFFRHLFMNCDSFETILGLYCFTSLFSSG